MNQTKFDKDILRGGEAYEAISGLIKGLPRSPALAYGAGVARSKLIEFSYTASILSDPIPLDGFGGYVERLNCSTYPPFLIQLHKTNLGEYSMECHSYLGNLSYFYNAK